MMLEIIVALLVIIITFLLFRFYIKLKSKNRGIIIIGLADAGKTVIFSRLVYKKYMDTYTSISENIAEYQPENAKKPVQLIDIPGDERVRTRIFNQYKTQARALVFVVDSSTVQKSIRDVAEGLYTVLIDNYVLSSKMPILVLCNKQDLPVAKGPQLIKNLLEKELNMVRRTKINQLQSIDDKINDVNLGRMDKDFDFSQLQQNIIFEGSSAIQSKEDSPPDIEQFCKWIETIL